MLQGPDAVDQLRREAAKLKKINAALMSRVERSMDQQLNAFSLFETAIALDHKVRDRTHQLREALHSVERANEGLYRAKQQAEAASSLKSSVLISVTHDLLQPLNAARLTLSALTEMVESQDAGLLIDQVDRSLLTLEDLLRSLLEIAKLDPFSFASHPVLVRVGGSYYARSIQRVEPDGSLHFFCAIDEGMVLTAATSRSLVGSTQDVFAQMQDQIGEVSLYIGFECLLRRLDAEQHQLARDMSELYRQNRVVGFHTYGEQFGSMHVNQTFTGVAIGRRQA